MHVNVATDFTVWCNKFKYSARLYGDISHHEVDVLQLKANPD